MNPHYLAASHPALRRLPRALQLANRARVISRFGAALLASVLVLSLQAQAPGPGRIVGRIYNPATQEYVRNAEIVVQGTNIVAFSGDDGSYVLSGIPAGEASVAVIYTGYEPAVNKVQVQPGETVTRDFELKGATFGPGGRATPGGPDSVVTLEKFVVSNEREGNAKAIMEQRAALNMKSVVASDNFGDVTGGNIGEFMK